MTFSPRIAVVLALAVVLAGCGLPKDYALKSNASWAEGQAIFLLLLSEPRFKEVADRTEPFTVRVDLISQGGATYMSHSYTYAAGSVTDGKTNETDFTLTTSISIALAVLNADDRFRVFACAMKANAATFEANNMLHAASFNGAKSRIFESADDCTAKPGDKVTFRGLEGPLLNGTMLNEETGFSGLPPLVAHLYPDHMLVFNEWRAPTRWIETYDHHCLSITIEDGRWVDYRDLCAGVGTSVPSSALADCAAKVKEAYADEPPAEGWSAGQAAGRAAEKAAEEALCQLVFGGS